MIVEYSRIQLLFSLLEILGTIILCVLYLSCLKQFMGGYSIYQKTVSTTIFRQLVPQKAAKGVGVLRIIQKNS